MPTLNWIGKEQIINHHNDVPFRVLERKYSFGEIRNENDSGDQISNSSFQFSNSKIIHGDNLEALKALLPEYEGRIKCIYIDPPYNTGNENWVYNDNVNSPKIRKWLGQVVGKESEDLSRHDKWLCMMYPRLVLLQKLLSDDGAIFISIDDNEQANLKLICDEIFGAGNFVAQFVWQKKTGAADPKGIATITEYILCYCGSIAVVNEIFTKNFEAFDIRRYRYKDEYKNERGPFYFDSLDRGSIRYSDTLNYEIKSPTGDSIFPNGRKSFENDGWTWKWSKEKVQWGIDNGFISIEKNSKSKNGWSVKYKIYLNVDNEGNKIEKSVPFKNLITNILNADASARMKEIFQAKVFEYAKPVELIEFFLKCLKLDKSSIILDSFAGSGTTAHAVLNLNKQDGGNRKFILVEMEDYAENITAERVRRVINGYGEGKNAVEGTGGSFSYYELGEPIFNEDGFLNESVGTEKLREYVWYTETRVPYVGLSYNGSRQNEPKNGCHTVTALRYLLGNHNGTAYYFYYEPDQITTLSHETLAIIGEKAETYVVYADQCVIDREWLAANNIIFKKIPRDIRKF
ncbi:MAG: site-specific DNA-methyltransferase [Bacteroidales bacterium]|nr:site-specific DNA-methyltransferase [Bacteroidales bacterium]